MGRYEKATDIAIVIPTYNEAENIEDLVREIHKVLPGCDIIVVDDNSPDGTAALVNDIRDPKVRLIVRNKKNGRGGAVLAGIKYALESRKNYQKIIEMDADFSHDPIHLVEILDKSQDCDIVVGSRYTAGSEIVNWSVQRKVFSFLANRFAAFLLKVPISDYTNGYRCYFREAAKSIPLDKIDASGYIVLSEIAVWLHKKGFAFGEVPIKFVNRQRGVSKLSSKEVLSALTGIMKLGWRTRPFRSRKPRFQKDGKL